MTERVLWSIGPEDGTSPDIMDTYQTPELLDEVVWRVPLPGEEGPVREDGGLAIEVPARALARVWIEMAEPLA